MPFLVFRRDHLRSNLGIISGLGIICGRGSFAALYSTVSKNSIKMIGHHSRLRDVMAQSYPFYDCTRANHARYSSVNVTFCGRSKRSS